MTILAHPHGDPVASSVSMRAWTLYSAILGPTALVGAWLVAGLVQPADYNGVQQSISALADHAASQRWIMTSGLYVIGICQLLTAAGLTQLRTGPRLCLAAGGVTGLGVAYFPQPEHGLTNTSPHIIFATLSIAILAAWPAIIGVRGLQRPHPFTTRTVAGVSALFVGLLVWVYVAGHGAGALGVAERVDTTVENLWPLVIVLVVRRTQTGAQELGLPAGRWGLTRGSAA